ncbi:MAG: long-chain fatty acid--CoA ligase [bacterium]
MNLNEMLDISCAKHAKSKAIIADTNRLTYAQLHEQVIACAHQLGLLGIRKNDCVAILLRNSVEFIVSYFALIRLGAIAVPINFLLKPPEIEYIINDCTAKAVITQAKFLQNAVTASERILSVRHFIVIGKLSAAHISDTQISKKQRIIAFADLLKKSARIDTNPAKNKPFSPDHHAMYIYTSGTTGKPKGVILSHANLISNVSSCIQATDVSSKDKFICLLPMFHSFAWLVCVLIPIYIGGLIVPVESIQPFRNVMKAVFKYKITIFAGVPQLFAALRKIPFFSPLRIFIPIRLCICGAAPLSPQILEDFQKKYNIPLIEGYGLTEASPVVTLNPIKGIRKPGSIGIPIPDVTVAIADTQGKLHTVSSNVGEICVKGPNVMKGYYHKPEETKEVLTKDRWLHTGDMGYIDNEGYVYIVDRKKDLIISKGLNIYPKEVEDVLQSHKAVQESSVIGVPKRNQDEMVIAYVTLKSGSRVTDKELIAYCRKHIAQYKVPREIILADELPKNTLGKVLKTTLREKALQKYGSML